MTRLQHVALVEHIELLVLNARPLNVISPLLHRASPLHRWQTCQPQGPQESPAMFNKALLSQVPPTEALVKEGLTLNGWYRF